MDKNSKRIICTAFSAGKKHDLKLFKDSKTKIHMDTETIQDTGYTGIERIHVRSTLPKKKSKKGQKRTLVGKELSREEKEINKEISSRRVLCENVIGMLKRYKILCEKYRNRRKRFGLRFNLLAGIYNFELTA